VSGLFFQHKYTTRVKVAFFFGVDFGPPPDQTPETRPTAGIFGVRNFSPSYYPTPSTHLTINANGSQVRGICVVGVFGLERRKNAPCKNSLSNLQEANAPLQTSSQQHTPLKGPLRTYSLRSLLSPCRRPAPQAGRTRLRNFSSCFSFTRPNAIPNITNNANPQRNLIFFKPRMK